MAGETNDNKYEVVTPEGDVVEVVARSASVDTDGYLGFFRPEFPGAANGYIGVAGFSKGNWCYWTKVDAS